MARHADVTVLTQTRNRPGIEKWMEREMPEDPGFKIEYVQFPGLIYRLKSRFDPLTLPYYAAWQLLALRRARALHREKPFDLAHHVTFVTFRVPVWLKLLGIPVVFGPVGGAETAPWKLLAHRISLKAWIREAFRNIATGLGIGMLRVFRPVRGRCGICLAATPGMDRVFRSLGMRSKLLPAIGVDLEEERPPSGSASDPIRFLYVGRLHPLKGVHMLIEAFAKACIEHSTLTMVGSGSVESDLRSLAGELGVSEQIRWLGQQARQDLPDHYRDHDVLVAPSLYESGGLAVLEAMQQSRPAIVLAVGGHDLSVAEGCGLKVSPEGSAEEVVDRLADAMRRYADEPELAVVHGRAGRLRLEEEYSWPKKAAHMLAIYESLMPTGKEGD